METTGGTFSGTFDGGTLFSAISKSLSLIIFNTQGTVLWVNSNFAKAMEYEVDEMIGLHHSAFCLPEFVSSPRYTQFWTDLRRGKEFQDKIKRVTKRGQVLVLEATYVPLYNTNGTVEGVVKVATDITHREAIVQSSTTELMAMVEEMTANTNEVLVTSNVIASNMKTLNDQSESVRGTVNDIQSIVSMVQRIAQQSELLGLNAAIEAAHAGVHGRGFGVVANEVRKMADSSKSYAQDISTRLSTISESITSMVDQMASLANQINDNLESISELKQAYDRIATTTEHLSVSL